jgi:hypothetical protein
VNASLARGRLSGRAEREGPQYLSKGHQVPAKGLAVNVAKLPDLLRKLCGHLLISCDLCQWGRREKAPASIATRAFSKASFGVDESELVTNSSTFTLSRPAIMRGFPSERLTLARHLPGFCSKAFTINRLYSTADPEGYTVHRARRE